MIRARAITMRWLCGLIVLLAWAAGPLLAQQCEWSPLGSGTNASVTALTVFDDGTGPALYAGGFFTMAGGVAAGRIAKWDGTEWSSLGSGTNLRVDALAVFDDGKGPALYTGGLFSIAGGRPSSHIGAWRCVQP